MTEEIEHDVERSQLISLFKSWTADLIMEGRLFHPDKDTLKSFLEMNFPQYVNDTNQIWAEFHS